MQPGWYRTAWRRNVVDTHIQDWDERFMARFDPDAYVGLLSEVGAQSAVVNAYSAVGICMYPSQVGHTHAGLRGRDLFGEVLERCHAAGIAVVAIVCFLWDLWADENLPDVRIVRADGSRGSADTRHGQCCPNSPYRDYARDLLQELCTRYDVDGVRIDMTFWYNVCYCRHCRRRYAEEVGGEPPRTVDWRDPVWVNFQRKREEWLLEYASLLTGTVKGINPDISVEHQSSTMPMGFVGGVGWQMADRMDFLQGDFYGGTLQGCFVNKLLYSLTPNRPFGFETSSSPQLRDQTGLKSAELIRARAFAAVANGGAFVFIDQIDPDGTVNPRPYRRIASVYRELARYEPYLVGEMVQDVAVYFSTASKVNLRDNGRDVLELTGYWPEIPHLSAVLAATRSLLEAHIPFGVVTKRSLADLSRYRVVILADVTMMDEEEVAAFRDYVAGGGGLYASAGTSLLRSDGVQQPDFMLGDVFGVVCEGETEHEVTYFVPEGEGEGLMSDWTREHPCFLPEPQWRLRLRDGSGAATLATLGLPYTLHRELRRFSSVHNDPPDKDLAPRSPALVERSFGRGRCIYAGGALERYEENRGLFADLIGRLLPQPTMEVAAPPAIETTLFADRDERRYRVNLLNFQERLPNVPAAGIRVRLHIPEQVSRVVTVPDERPVAWEQQDGVVSFEAPVVETFVMVSVEHA